MDKIPYIIESKDNDVFTINVKGTKPYIELQQENKQLKDNWNKLQDIINIKLIRLESEPDYCNYYVSGLENAVNLCHKSISGVAIEMVKNAMININKEILNKMQELENGDSNE